MSKILQTLITYLGLPLIEKLVKAIKELILEKIEEKRKINELKAKIKVLKEAKTSEELRAAIRNINI